MSCIHSYVLIPASKSYWPVDKPANGIVEYHRVCLKCQEITRCFVANLNEPKFEKCIGCTREICDTFKQCNELVIKAGQLFDWIASLRHHKKGS